MSDYPKSRKSLQRNECAHRDSNAEPSDPKSEPGPATDALRPSVGVTNGQNAVTSPRESPRLCHPSNGLTGTQLDVFDMPIDPQPIGDAWARSTDPDTAHDAAERERGARAAHLAAIVLRALTELGAATSREVADYTGYDLVTVSPRFRPLERRQIIEECGKRKNPSGSSAIVWRLRQPAQMEAAS